MNPKKLLGNVPWITKDSNLDVTRSPIDNILKQALSEDTDADLVIDRVFVARCDAGGSHG